MPQAPAAVRPAATVVVLRPRRGDDLSPQLYMLRRSSKSAFMPDALVFPGGRVEAEDGSVDLATDAGESARRATDAAFAQAARRECMEEASLGLAGELRWFDTWKTPSGESPRRFLARFFVTCIAADAGGDAQADGGETYAGRWASAEQVLGQWRDEQVDLPPPTLSVLLRVAAGDWRTWLSADPERARPAIVPKLATVDASVHIVMPHDPAYAGLPGDAGVAPERALAYPRRFIRAGKRWLPQT